MRTPPRRVLVAAQLIAAALLLYFVGRSLAAQWIAFRDQPLAVHVQWRAIAASGAFVLGSYALLVQTWRMLLAAAGESLGFWRAAAIWSISNLWRYVPGKVWQIGAMGALARREKVGATAAASSALLSTLLNIAVGLAIMLLLGWRWMNLIAPGARALAVALVGAAAAGLLALPFVLTRLGRWAASITGREIALAAPRAPAVVLATMGNVVAWILYGVAFMWLVHGVLGAAAGAAWQYVAVYTASYVVGYLFLILPGGIGPREGVMVALLRTLELATPQQALLIAGASRVWLTILEIVPGVLFLTYGLRRRGPAPPPSPTHD